MNFGKKATPLGVVGDEIGNSSLAHFFGKQILITGHTGFKGVWLTQMLLKFGAEVFGLALEAEPGSLYTRFQGNHFSGETFVDIRNRDKVRKFFKENNFDGIFHLAAQPLVIKSYQKPIDTFETNVMGTANILDSLLEFKSAPWIIVVTSDKVYKNHESLVGYSEDSPLGGVDPYSASKAACEMVVSAFRNMASLESKKIELVSARSGNVIGGGDISQDRLMPDLIKSFRSKQKALIRQPNSIRPWQHVLDPLNGYLLLGSKLISGEKIESAYNFGPDDRSKITVEEMVKIACTESQESIGYEIVENLDLLPETTLLWLDSSLAMRDLKWSNKLSAEESIKWTLEWEEYVVNTPVSKVVANQISKFLELNP